MALIKMDDGNYLNSNCIIKFRRLRDNTFKFLDVNGGEHVGAPNLDDQPFEAFFPIVPAAAGYSVISTDVVNGERIYTFNPVVAWRLAPGGNYPLAAGGNYNEDDGYAAIKSPSGEVIDVDGNCFKSVDEFKALVAEEDEGRIAKAA